MELQIDQEGFPNTTQPVEGRLRSQTCRQLCTSKRMGSRGSAFYAQTYRPLEYSFHNHLDEDQEFGEATSSHLVVLRPPYNFTSRNMQKDCRSAIYMMSSSFPMSPNENMIDQNTEISLKPYVENNRFSVKKSIVPNVNSQRKKKSKIFVPIWKELIIGQLIFEEHETKYSKIKAKYFPKTGFFRMISYMSKFIPYTIVHLIVTCLAILLFLMSWISIEVSFYYRLYVHIMIHQLGENQENELVFTGAGSTGPIVYFMRFFSCPYCRQQRQERISRKYFTTLMEERRDILMKKKNTND